jgi:cation diffusion facilitator family transporter
VSTSAETDEKTLRLSVLLYAGLMALKLGVWWWTGVMSLLAEGLHTLTDVFVAGFLLIAARWSRRQPDDVHPYGYGRAQYIGALVASVLFISFTAFELFREAITRLVGHELPHPSHDERLALYVLGFSMLVGLWPLLSLLRQRNLGAAARAQLLELVNDELGLLAAGAGTLLVMAGYPLADPLASMVVASMILFNGVSLFRENLSYLIGRSLPPERLSALTTLILSVPGVQGVHRLRVEQLAHESLHVEMHVEVERGMVIEAADDIAEEVTRQVAAFTSGPNYVSVHVDPVRAPGERRRSATA